VLAISASLHPDDVLKAIARQACALTASQSSAAYLFDADTNTLQLVTGHRLPARMTGTRFASNKGVVGRAFGAKRVMVMDSVPSNSPDAAQWKGRRVAVVSLIAGGKRWGVLQVMRGCRTRPFNSYDVDALEWFAPVAAQAIANAQEFYRSVQAIGQFQVANERLRAVGNIARGVIDVSSDPDRLLAQTVEGICKSLRLRGGAVRLHDERTGQLVTVVERDMPKAARERGVLCHTLLIELLRDTDDVGTLITVPLVAKEQAIGILQVFAPPGRELTSDDRDALAIIAHQLALGIDNARLFRQVQTEKQWLRAILSSTDNVVLSMDAEGKLLTANAAAERAFGFRAQVCIGQPVSQATTNVSLNLALEQAIFQCDARRRTFQVPLADDRVLFASMSPILTPDGVVQGWVFVMQDFTQFQEMEKLQADMILTASHELRNPVNLTLGALELLEKSMKLPDETQREALDLARLGLERASVLITDLLDLERIERRIGLRMRQCNCTQLLRTIGAEFRLRAQNRRTALQVRVPNVPLNVWGDDQLLYRVLSNLVDNALKYTPSEGKVVVEARAEAGQVLLEVADTGPGIPLEAQPYVFERFYRLERQPDGITGTGLGLTIVKSIVEQHGGRVWVTSQPGHGSVFTVSLPAFQIAHR
jgi:PAS domain S-box-containing protein